MFITVVRCRKRPRDGAPRAFLFNRVRDRAAMHLLLALNGAEGDREIRIRRVWTVSATFPVPDLVPPRLEVH